jgi:hypothetical protein
VQEQQKCYLEGTDNDHAANDCLKEAGFQRCVMHQLEVWCPDQAACGALAKNLRDADKFKPVKGQWPQRIAVTELTPSHGQQRWPSNKHLSFYDTASQIQHRGFNSLMGGSTRRESDNFHC